MLEIPSLVSIILKSFSDLMSTRTNILPENLSAAQSYLSKFKIWTGSLGAHHLYGHQTLEYQLSGSLTIRDHVVLLLRDLREQIQEAYTATQKGSSPEEFNHNGELDADLAAYFQDDDDFTKDQVALALDQVKSTMNRLMRLSLTIRNPASYEHVKENAPELVDAYLASDMDHVQNKFPRLHEEVRARLGKSLTHRRLFFRYRANHNSRLSAGLDDESHAGESGVTTLGTEASWHPKDKGDADGMQQALIGDDMSEVSATSYAISSDGTLELRVPPIPSSHVDGPFQCPYCCLPVEIKDRYHWKRHVFTDLRPYVCLAESCSLPNRGFPRRRDWFHHTLEHCRSYICPFGCVGPFAAPTTFRDHILEDHITEASSESIDTMVPSCSEIDPDRLKGSCPVCCEVDIQTSRHYQSHVGDHLEQMALFVLPGIGGKDNDVEADQLATEHEDYEYFDNEEQIPSMSATNALASVEQTASPNAFAWPSLAHPNDPSYMNMDTSTSELPPRNIDTENIPEFDTRVHNDDTFSSPVYIEEPVFGSNSKKEGVLSNKIADSTAKHKMGEGPSQDETARVASRSESVKEPSLNDRYTASTGLDSGIVPSKPGDKPGHHIYVIWMCCMCGHAGMDAHRTPACVDCGRARCGNCPVEQYKHRSKH